MLPNFLVIGAMKSGTTSLWQYLRLHPQVFMPTMKEPNFFAAECNWDLGIGWYEHLFEGAEDAVARGEASVIYTLYPNNCGVPSRIYRVVPKVKLIYLVRHPVERSISHVWHDLRDHSGGVDSVEEALLTRPRFVNISRYSMQIEQYLEFFPKVRVLAIKSEDLKHRRGSTLQRVFEFLDVDPTWLLDDVEREWNQGVNDTRKRSLDRSLRRVPAYGLLARISPEPIKLVKRRVTTERIPRPAISQEVRDELTRRLRDDVSRLYAYMEPGFDGWGIA